MSRFLDELGVFSVRPGVACQTGMDTSSMGSKAPMFTNKLLSHNPLGKHQQDGGTLAWLCSKGSGRLGHHRIVVNKYYNTSGRAPPKSFFLVRGTTRSPRWTTATSKSSSGWRTSRHVCATLWFCSLWYNQQNHKVTCGWWRPGVGFVALDLALACLFIRFSKTVFVTVGYGALLLAVGTGSAAHVCVQQLTSIQM